MLDVPSGLPQSPGHENVMILAVFIATENPLIEADFFILGTFGSLRVTL